MLPSRLSLRGPTLLSALDPWSWTETWRADPEAAALADRHYPRRAPGTRQFVAPGIPLVLVRPGVLWISLISLYADHAWPGAWLCAAFRCERRDLLASELIRSAVARTVETWGDLPEPHRMITFVDPAATAARRGRANLPGHCFRAAGWREVGWTPGGHGRAELVVLQAPHG